MGSSRIVFVWSMMATLGIALGQGVNVDVCKNRASRCMFKDHNQEHCFKGWFYPDTDNPFRDGCERLPIELPPKPFNCTPKQCDDLCEEISSKIKWGWAAPKCSPHDDPHEVSVKRDPLHPVIDKYHQHLVVYCKKTSRVMCTPPSPTTAAGGASESSSPESTGGSSSTTTESGTPGSPIGGGGETASETSSTSGQSESTSNGTTASTAESTEAGSTSKTSSAETSANSTTTVVSTTINGTTDAHNLRVKKKDDPDGEGLSGVAIALIVIGVLLLVAALIIAIVAVVVSKKKSKPKPKPGSVNINYERSDTPAVDECVGASLRDEDSMKSKSRPPNSTSRKSVSIADGSKSMSSKQSSTSMPKRGPVPLKTSSSPLIKSESSKQISKPIDPKQPKPVESKSKPPMMMTKM